MKKQVTITLFIVILIALFWSNCNRRESIEIHYDEELLIAEKIIEQQHRKLDSLQRLTYTSQMVVDSLKTKYIQNDIYWKTKFHEIQNFTFLDHQNQLSVNVEEECNIFIDYTLFVSELDSFLLIDLPSLNCINRTFIKGFDLQIKNEILLDILDETYFQIDVLNQSLDVNGVIISQKNKQLGIKDDYIVVLKTQNQNLSKKNKWLVRGLIVAGSYIVLDKIF